MLPIANIENPTIWIIAGVAVLLLFGGQKIPEMMKGLGSGMREFKKGMNGEDDTQSRKEQDTTHKAV